MQINAKTLGFKYGDRILVYVCTNAEWYTSRLMWFYSNNKIRRNKNLKFLPKLQARSIYFCFFNFAKKGERKKDVDDVLAIVTAVAAQMLRIAKKKERNNWAFLFSIRWASMHTCISFIFLGSISLSPYLLLTNSHSLYCSYWNCKKKEKNHCSIYVDEIDTIIMMIISHIT